MRASKAAREYVQWASEKQRRPCPIAELWVSTKCGESDTTAAAAPTRRGTPSTSCTSAVPLLRETTELTGGEQIVAARCANDAVREKFMFMFDRYQRSSTGTRRATCRTRSRPRATSPGPDDDRGEGVGNIQKIGKTCTVDGVIDKAEMPTHPGLWFMDSSRRRPRW
jgi:(2R)-sulfolactate sulfo-lyase subunit beta